MWSLARRPRWIAALFLCLAIAAGFAALGQWQLSRSVDAGVPVDGAAETLVPLPELAEPQQGLSAAALGRLVTVEGTLLADECVVLSGRLHEGVAGFWVVGHVRQQAPAAEPGPSIAVALGWAPTEEAAQSAISRLESNQAPQRFAGRYLPSEAPQEDDFENGEQNSLSTAALVNQWPTSSLT